ncbi:MAG TPA: hypothetical protein PKA64_25965, partial [Myxococcota bacterium]|nr:hypothetical protein [Myxococcota bacterium]
DGVGCAACHVDGGEILAARPPLPDAVEAHPIRVIPSLTGAETCGRCHAFPFQRHTPGPFAYGETPAQDTVAEWSRSSAAGTPCAGCHMPDGAHSFPGAHDPALVRGALDLRVVRRGARVVAVVSSDPPHRIPTGDPFRGIELRVCGDAGCSGPTASSQLRRRFAPDATSWALIDDTTLSPWRPRRRLVAPWIEGASRWELWYRFGERRLEPELPAAEVGYVITAGDLAP